VISWLSKLLNSPLQKFR